MMSSPHGPDKLGYTRATKVITKSCTNVNFSQTLKIIVVQIIDCNSSI